MTPKFVDPGVDKERAWWMVRWNGRALFNVPDGCLMLAYLGFCKKSAHNLSGCGEFD